MAAKAQRCVVCTRDPQRMNSEFAECSVVDCPHRGKAWSDRPQPGYTAPEAFSSPLDAFFDTDGEQGY